MSSFNAIMNSQAFSVTSENELSEVLANYNSDFVFNIVDSNMKNRFISVPIINLPNIVAAWEQNFKAIISTYGERSASEVHRVRNETYKEIINIICREFKLNFTIDDSVDLYSAAYHLYDLFVSGFTKHMIEFFVNYIYKERISIYDSLNLVDLKKNKDSSTLYAKKIFKDQKLAIINANIEMVISEISAMEFPFYTIIMTIFGANSEFTKYYLSLVSADNDFFQTAYLSVLNNPSIRPEIITSIRFALQQLSVEHDQVENDDAITK